MTLQEAIGQVAALEQQVSYLVNDIAKNNEERTRLVTHLDICRMSLRECVKQNEEYEQAHIKLEQIIKDQNGKIDALTDLIKSMRPYVGQIQIPHGSMFLKQIKVLLKSETK